MNNPDSITEDFDKYIFRKNGNAVSNISIGVGEEISIFNYETAYISNIGGIYA